MTPIHCEAYNGYLIAIYPDDDAECPLDWEQLQHAKRSKSLGAHLSDKTPNIPGVYWITFERDSALKNHHFTDANDVLKYAKNNDYLIFALHGHCSDRGYNADYEVRPLANEWHAHLHRVAILGEDHEEVQDNAPEVSEVSGGMEHVGFVLVHRSEFPQNDSEPETQNMRAMELATAVTKSVTKWCNGEYVGFKIFQPTEDNFAPSPPDGEVNNAFSPFDPEDHEEDWEEAHSLNEISVWGYDDVDYALQEAKEIINAHTPQPHENTPQGETTCSGVSTDHESR